MQAASSILWQSGEAHSALKDTMGWYSAVAALHDIQEISCTSVAFTKPASLTDAFRYEGDLLREIVSFLYFPGRLKIML